MVNGTDLPKLASLKILKLLRSDVMRPNVSGGYLLFLASTAMALLTSIAMAPAERGLMGVYLQVAALTTVTAFAGLEKIILREAHQLTRRLYFRLFFESAGIALLISGLALFALDLDQEVPFWQQFVASALLISAAIYQSFIHTHAVATRSRSYLLQVTVSQSSLLMFGVGLWVLEITSAWTWILAYSASLWLGNLASIPTVLGSKKFTDPSTPPLAYVSLRRMGLIMISGTFGWQITMRLDRLYLPLFANLPDVGIYLVSLLALDVTVAATQVRVDASINDWTEASAAGRPLKHKLWLEVGWLVSLAVVAHLALLGLVLFVLEEAYAPVVDLLAPIFIVSLLLALSRVFLGLIVSSGRLVLATVADTSLAVLVTITGLVGLQLGYGTPELVSARLACALIFVVVLLFTLSPLSRRKR